MEDLKIHLREVRDRIEVSKKISILTHTDPDGDAIGSASALHLALLRAGRNVETVIQGSVADTFYTLSLPLFKSGIEENTDLAIILDCANLDRTGSATSVAALNSVYIVNIDHHPQEKKFGHINIVDEKATSSSELVYYLISELGIDIDREISSLLLMGILSDTGNFMHSCTTSRVLDVAAFLVSRGANIRNISEKVLRQKKISTLKLWGKVLSRIKSDRGKGIVSSVITHKDLDECGATKEELEGVVNLLATIPESKASLLLREDMEGNVRGSLRSNTDTFDVRKVASIFGGGGHRRASGFKIKGRLKENPDGWEIEEE